jgi:uncharacterized membrane protein YeaQ/YmgE (transglycosylase-associated protein family)
MRRSTSAFTLWKRCSAVASSFFGLVVGVVAEFVMPGRDPGGMILTIVLGIVRSLSTGMRQSGLEFSE